jgi:hypothetical protein
LDEASMISCRAKTTACTLVTQAVVCKNWHPLLGGYVVLQAIQKLPPPHTFESSIRYEISALGCCPNASGLSVAGRVVM